MSLSCLKHVKRGQHGRPDVPPAYVDAVAVLDRSGSMVALLPGATAGVRHFLDEQKARHDNSYVEVVTFDDKVEIPYSGKTNQMMGTDIDACIAALFARNMTRLYDTAIEAIHRQMKRLENWSKNLPRAVKRLAPKPIAILFVLTDGLDNKSLADAAAFKRAVKCLEKTWGATCIFVAANQDAMRAGAAYGFNPDTVLQMDADAVHTQAAFKSATASAARACSGQIPTMTQLERSVTCSAYAVGSPPAYGRNVTAPPGYPCYNSDSDDDSDAYSNMACGGGAHTPTRSRAGVACSPPPHYLYPMFAPQNVIQNAAAAAAAAASSIASIPLPPRIHRLQRQVAAAMPIRSNS